MLQFESLIEVLPGFRIVPESPTYQIREGMESGGFYYMNSAGETVDHRFVLINKIGKPDEMAVFNTQILNQACTDKLTQAFVGDKAALFGLYWKPHTGLASP